MRADDQHSEPGIVAEPVSFARLGFVEGVPAVAPRRAPSTPTRSQRSSSVVYWRLPGCEEHSRAGVQGVDRHLGVVGPAISTPAVHQIWGSAGDGPFGVANASGAAGSPAPPPAPAISARRSGRWASNLSLRFPKRWCRSTRNARVAGVSGSGRHRAGLSRSPGHRPRPPGKLRQLRGRTTLPVARSRGGRCVRPCTVDAVRDCSADTGAVDDASMLPWAGRRSVCRSRSTAGSADMGSRRHGADGLRRPGRRPRLRRYGRRGVHRLDFLQLGVDFVVSTGQTGFYPEVSVTFDVVDPDQHYHVPLLLSPYAFSTYRGS